MNRERTGDMYGGDKRRNNKETGKELMVEEKNEGR